MPADYTMKKEIKQKWVKALRSMDHGQGFDRIWADGPLICNDYDVVSATTLTDLIKLNDNGNSFEDIVNYIEKNL